MVDDDKLYDWRRKKKKRNFKPNIKLKDSKSQKNVILNLIKYFTDHFQTFHCLNKNSDHTENLDLQKNYSCKCLGQTSSNQLRQYRIRRLGEHSTTRWQQCPLCVSSGFTSKVCSSVESFLKLFTYSLMPFLRKLNRPVVNTEGIMLQQMWHQFFYSLVHTLSLSSFYSQDLGTAYLVKSSRVCNQQQKQWLGLSKDYRLLSHVTISGT